MLDSYLGVKMAVLELAYDNGMINRLEPQQKYLSFVERCAANINPGLLNVWSAYLVALSNDEFSDFVCGDWDHEANPGPEGLNEFLNKIFEGY